MLAEGGRVGNASGDTGSPRACVSPGAAPRSRDRTEAGSEQGARRSMCADTSSTGDRHRGDHGSSSDTESDFYEEIDVSCTPESMDYPTGKGKTLEHCGVFCLCMWCCTQSTRRKSQQQPHVSDRKMCINVEMQRCTAVVSGRAVWLDATLR